MAFTLMSDHYQKIMIGQKKAFGYRVLNEYFEFVYGATGQKDKGILGELEMGRIQRE